MAESNFLYRALTVRIHSARLLLTSLSEMIKLASSAVLISKDDRIQILAAIPNRDAYAILEMQSSFSVDLSSYDGYALLFNLSTWIQRLNHPNFQQPSVLLFIEKSPGSPNLKCIFGENQESIDLGKAEFVQAQGVCVNDFPCRVRVMMRSQHLREFAEALASRNDHVQLAITNTSIHWLTQSGQRIHSSRDCDIKGVTPGTVFRFGLWWDWPLFQVLCSASNSYQIAVFTAVVDPFGREWNRFRFFNPGHSYSFCYIQIHSF